MLDLNALDEFWGTASLVVLTTSFVRHVLFVVDVAFFVVLTTSFGRLVLLFWGSLSQSLHLAGAPLSARRIQFFYAFVLGIAGRRCANARAELESEVRSEKSLVLIVLMQFLKT